MREFVMKSAEALMRFWNREKIGRKPLDFGRAAKLVNLIVKHLLRLRYIPPAEKRRLQKLLDVALDSYTLRGIRRICDDPHIPSTATMGFVKDKKTYTKIQNKIRTVLEPQFYPIEYDLLAWNSAH
jgi:hypothetical protein